MLASTRAFSEHCLDCLMPRLKSPVKSICQLYAILLVTCSGLLSVLTAKAADTAYEVKAVSVEQVKEYKLRVDFYKKCTEVQGILIATSDKVSDYTHLEAAYLFDRVMCELKAPIAQRIRDKKVLCILVGVNELTSDIPQFASDKTGKELDFYNWRQRGFLTTQDNRPTVLFAEEDVLEFDGGMKLESILIHEFGHVIDGAGFDEELRAGLTAAYKNAKETGLYNDGYAAQRFERVKSATPVSLVEALVKSFPAETPEFFRKCLEGGDILVNLKPAAANVEVTKADKVRIVFGGPKQCYALGNQAEYWAEGVQDWFDTNRTMDHDHNHIHTRDQLKVYDPQLAKLCEAVFGDSSWRFVSPRIRAGTEHLKGYDPLAAPKAVELEHIKDAGRDYYDEYWKDFWKRLHAKYPAVAAVK